MDLGITGKKAAVAAASAGLGLATAKALAAEGVHVAICGRHQDRIDDPLAVLGPHAVGIVADVSDLDQATQFVGFVGDPDEFGRVVAFLCSTHARFITGATIPVEGGATKGLM